MLLLPQSGRPVVVESRKKKPFEPLSIKLLEYATPWNVVMKFPELSAACAWALFSALLDCVPIPKIMEPVTDSAPVAAICGRTIAKPLLSCGNEHACAHRFRPPSQGCVRPWLCDGRVWRAGYLGQWRLQLMRHGIDERRSQFLTLPRR